MQMNLFETPAEKRVRELPGELAEIVTLLKLAWCGDSLSRGAWINQLGAFGSATPESDFERLLADGVLRSAVSDQYRMEAE